MMKIQWKITYHATSLNFLNTFYQVVSETAPIGGRFLRGCFATSQYIKPGLTLRKLLFEISCISIFIIFFLITVLLLLLQRDFLSILTIKGAHKKTHTAIWKETRILELISENSDTILADLHFFNFFCLHGKLFATL